MLTREEFDYVYADPHKILPRFTRLLQKRRIYLLLINQKYFGGEFFETSLGLACRIAGVSLTSLQSLPPYLEYYNPGSKRLPWDFHEIPIDTIAKIPMFDRILVMCGGYKHPVIISVDNITLNISTSDVPYSVGVIKDFAGVKHELKYFKDISYSTFPEQGIVVAPLDLYEVEKIWRGIPECESLQYKDIGYKYLSSLLQSVEETYGIRNGEASVMELLSKRRYYREVDTSWESILATETYKQDTWELAAVTNLSLYRNQQIALLDAIKNAKLLYANLKHTVNLQSVFSSCINNFLLSEVRLASDGEYILGLLAPLYLHLHEAKEYQGIEYEIGLYKIPDVVIGFPINGIGEEISLSMTDGSAHPHPHCQAGNINNCVPCWGELAEDQIKHKKILNDCWLGRDVKSIVEFVRGFMVNQFTSERYAPVLTICELVSPNPEGVL
jgi:hypothetical protein